jgi:WD40 repeat protein/biotin carboxyl carrier protein
VRYFFGLVTLCIGVFLAVTYLRPIVDPDAPEANSPGLQGPDSSPEKSAVKDRVTPLVENEVQTPRATFIAQSPNVSRFTEPWIIVADARALSLDKQEVPSERDGKLLVIGTEVSQGEQVTSDRRFLATIGYLLVLIDPKEKVKPEQVITGQGASRWRRWQEGDSVEPGRVFLLKEQKEYKRLDIGDEVKAGQTVALVDPSLALGDLNIKIAALDSSESERRASVKTKEEAERRVAAMEESQRRVPGSVSKDDYEGAKLTAKRYYEEEIAKRSAVIKAQQELLQSNTILLKHEIQSTIPGTIKVIYKNRGDAVKTLEPVMQIQRHDRLRIEGYVDVQDTARIKPGKTDVVIEPTQPVSRLMSLEGHFDEVTGVAVARGAIPTIISGSADRTVGGWNSANGQLLWRIPHRTAVLSVASTGLKAERNLAIAGCADGTASLIDVDRFNDFANQKIKEQPEPLVLKGRHRGAVHCVAFSPDGKMCATGGEDREIYLWDTKTGDMLNQVPSRHRAPVTSLQFTPLQQLVSVSRDNTLVVWSVESGKPPVRVTEFERRSGDVPQLSVSPDGTRVLFDQDKEIRLLSLKTHQPEGIIRNASGATKFATMALFDPDGLTVLTSAGTDGRLQLWRTPTANSMRAAELRQFMWSEGAATSGAFSPDGSFCVTGMQDRRVLVWPMPERKRDARGHAELVEKEIRSRISKVEEFIDSSNRKVPVFVELENPDNRLVPGSTATLVIQPETKAH